MKYILLTILALALAIVSKASTFSGELSPQSVLAALPGRLTSTVTEVNATNAVIDCSLGAIFHISLTTNATVTLTNASQAASIVAIVVDQGAQNSWTVTWGSGFTVNPNIIKLSASAYSATVFDAVPYNSGLLLKASSALPMLSVPMTLWLDAKANVNTTSGLTWQNMVGTDYATNTSSTAPSSTTNSAGLQVVRFFGTNFLSVTNIPITTSATQWAIFCIAKSYDYTQNRVTFDITEQTGSQSVVARSQFINSTFASSGFVRDAAGNSGLATTSEDMSAWKLYSIIRNGNSITLHINGNTVSTVSASIGSFTNTAYNCTIGAVINQSGVKANYMAGDVRMVMVCPALTSDQISQVESFCSTNYAIPLVLPTRVSTSSPVIGLGSAGANDAGRILEPTLAIVTNTWHMWYSGMKTNGGDLNQGWTVLHATSTDGTNWTKTGMVLSNAWEPDVFFTGGTFYMAHVRDTDYGVRIATSTDGITWTEKGLIVDSTKATWADTAPREPCLYYESGTWYLYFGAEETSSHHYKIGVSTCTSDPTVAANWSTSSSPMFASLLDSPGWNDGGDTESPCVRKYSQLAHPYVMTFIGWNSRGQNPSKPWRSAMCWADSPTGPWTEVKNNPVLTIGANGGWDDRITAEVTHAQTNGVFYLFYSGGKSNGVNQVGLAVMPVTSLDALCR